MLLKRYFSTGEALRLANHYFKEYHEIISTDISRALADRLRWSAAELFIRDLPIDEQAEYADYVLQKMCANHSKEILVELAESQLGNGFEIPSRNLNCAAIGNVALLIKSLPSGEFKDDLYDKFQKHLKATSDKD